MPIVPIRNLGRVGLLPEPDYSGTDIPSIAWTFGVNVRFHKGRVRRGPVFRTISSSLLFTSPRFLITRTPQSGFDAVMLCYLSGRVSEYRNSETDKSIAGYVNSDADTPFTGVHLSNVFYINRSDRVPWKYGPVDTQFQALANWDATWRTSVLRACNGALVALNVTKGASNFPTMVKTSQFTTDGAVPASWDHTLPSTNATENILAEMKGPIVDAQNFGNTLIIYGNREAWLMTLSRTTNIWDYRKLPFNNGAVNANCSVEVDGKHYVFGPTDIWMHDGTVSVSICNPQVRDLIYSSLNLQKANRCFVMHNPALKEIYFCYVSGDKGVAFLNAEGCNRAAVFNYGDGGNWTLYDLPFVFGGDMANVDQVLTWTTVTTQWDPTGGAWLDQEDSQKKVCVMVGDANLTYSLAKSLYAFDLPQFGSVSFPVEVNATRPATLEKDGIDLDELGAPLSGYKLVDTIYPQGFIEAGGLPLEFRVGGTDFQGTSPAFSDWQTFNANDLYKLDFRAAGRYLSIHMRHNDTHDFALSGLDLDLDVLGDR